MTSTASPEYLSTIEDWLKRRHELVVLIRYVYGAGSTDIELISTFGEFQARLARLSAKDSIIVYRDHQLPLRGVVDDSFIEKCLAAIPDGIEYIVAETELTTAGTRSWFHHDTGTTLRELKESLEHSRGKRVAVGECPDRLSEAEGVLDAYVPDSDGVVRPGAY